MLVRVLQLAKRVESMGPLRDLSQFARDYGVCTRTIYRDLQALEIAGFKVPPYRYWPREVIEQ